MKNSSTGSATHAISSPFPAFVLPRALVTVRRADFDIEPVVKAWDESPEMLDYGGRGLL